MLINDQENSLARFCQKKLEILEKAVLKRHLVARDLEEKEEGTLLCFSDNDYLELSKEESIIQAGIESSQKYGAGSVGSRLITGTSSLILDLEKKIACFKETEKALFFNSGYATNLGTISSLVGARSLVLLDQYAHSSLINGSKLSGAKIIFYQHNNLRELSKILSKERGNYSEVMIVTESLFSMDGDFANLNQLSEVCEKFSTWLLIDEAHSTGIYGDHGSGLVNQSKLKQKDYLIQVGTCSKALGVQGGFVCGSKELIDFLVQRAKTFIYSTAPSPFVIGAVKKSFEIIKEEKSEKKRQKLFRLISYFLEKSSKLKKLSFQREKSQIFCLNLRSNWEALKLSKELKLRKIRIQAIRKPTVPTPRLRIALSSRHSQEDIDYLLETLTLLI